MVQKHIYNMLSFNISKYSILFLINIIFLFGLFTYVYVLHNNEHYVVVDNVKLFNSFGLSKDLGGVYVGKINSTKNKLDSLSQLFDKELKTKASKEVLSNIRKQYNTTNNKLIKLQSDFKGKVSQQVWDRLNLYIREYGKKHKYKIIFGMQGSGNIMFTKSGVEKTDEILDYCNKRYEGEKSI